MCDGHVHLFVTSLSQSCQQGELGHIESMSGVIQFPVAVRMAQIGRCRRVFEAQRELEAMKRANLQFLAAAFAGAMILMGALDLIVLSL